MTQFIKTRGNDFISKRIRIAQECWLQQERAGMQQLISGEKFKSPSGAEELRQR